MTPPHADRQGSEARPLDRTRRAEILDTAASLIATSGMRTSLKEIADACGILPGSLYHHFESKEAILVELIERYRADLDRIADATRDRLDASTDRADDGPAVQDQIVTLARELAACALRHRAALLLTFYEPPSSASGELVRAAQHLPTAVLDATTDLLEAGRGRGEIRADLDLPTFADRFCQAMLHISLGVLQAVEGAERVPEARCRILLEGIAPRPPTDRQLDRSPAFAAAQRTIDSWDLTGQVEDERFAVLRSAARAEFGRRGYEATTVRDIAAAAGFSTGSVYRLVGSKDELLATVMGAFVTRVRTAWKAVLASEGSALEQLDALMWTDINLVHRFSDEFNIQVAWLRESPPRTSSLGWSFAARLRDVKSLLAEGTRSGEIRGPNLGADLRAWSLFELLWMPENLVDGLGPRAALTFARDTVIRGAGRRS